MEAIVMQCTVQTVWKVVYQTSFMICVIKTKEYAVTDVVC